MNVLHWVAEPSEIDEGELGHQERARSRTAASTGRMGTVGGGWWKVSQSAWERGGEGRLGDPASHTKPG